MSTRKPWKPYKQFNMWALLPQSIREKIRKTFVFTEVSGLKQQDQSPTPDLKYRYPAPDSMPMVNIPSIDSKERLYNTQYYTRDTRRAPVFHDIEYHPSLGIEKPIELPNVENTASPGNKNPAVLSYDPSGTRSAMTTTFAEMNKKIAQHLPTHNVRMAWHGHEQEIIDDCEAKGIPITPGTPFKWSKSVLGARIQKW